MTKPPSETPAAPLSPQEASAATPAAELERQIMYSGEPKNEREWWAAREIERLRARNEALTNWQARTKEREEHLHVAGHPTQEEIPPYTPDEQRAVDYITRDGTVGGGGDPIGFLISSHNYVNGLRQQADARIAEVEAERDEERGIVDRIWDLFGRPSYAELNGRSIYDLITALQARAESLERRNHDLAQDLEKAGRVVEEYWIAAWGGFTPDEADAARSKPMLNEERALYEIVRARRAGEEA